MPRLFGDLTGLRLDCIPTPSPDLVPNPEPLIASCRVHLRRWGRATSRRACERCARRNLLRALGTAGEGHRFRGSCGLETMMVPVSRPAGTRCLVVFRMDPGAASRSPQGDGADGTAVQVDRNGRFRRAASLLRLIVDDAETHRKATGIESDLSRVRRAVTSHEREEERLRGMLRRRLPDVRGTAARPVRGGRGHEVVERVLESVRGDFARPLVLRRLARELGTNSDYLSHLFASEVGIPFKSYLTMLRMQRAQELLSDPARRVSEVGYDVGYASPRRFRAAFRSWTGLSPSDWRRSLRAR